MASEILWHNLPQFYSVPVVGWKNCEANPLIFSIEVAILVRYTLYRTLPMMSEDASPIAHHFSIA